jgi:hypothetical protein
MPDPFFLRPDALDPFAGLAVAPDFFAGGKLAAAGFLSFGFARSGGALLASTTAVGNNPMAFRSVAARAAEGLSSEPSFSMPESDSMAV